MLGGSGDPAHAQQTDQPPTFRTGINFVRVDVIVSDKANQPVVDLRQADFEVAEDGKPQTINSFKLVTLDGGLAAARDNPPRAIRTDLDAELEASQDDVRLFAIFLDDYHLTGDSSRRVGAALATFVETELGPSDMVGVMYPRQLAASVRWTRDRAVVARAVRAFGAPSGGAIPQSDVPGRLRPGPLAGSRRQVSLGALKALIARMGSLKEGRKTLILVSEGFSYPLQAATGPSPLAQRMLTTEGMATMQTDLQEIWDAANRNNVAIYPVDPRALAAPDINIDRPTRAQRGGQNLSSTRMVLQILAEQTDGRAIISRNDLGAAMRQIVRDTSAYYLIGYNSTQSQSDGQFHEINVRVKKPGVQVRARKGYWALTAEDVVRMSAPPAAAPSKAVELALASISPVDSRVIRTWIGMSRGEGGKTKITFVWEPAPRTPGRAAIAADAPSRVSLTALGPDRAPLFEGAVPAGTAGVAGGNAARTTFEAVPGKLQLRLSIESASSRMMDAEVREIAVPDLKSAQVALGTPQVLRARTFPEYRQMAANPDATPVAAREFTRTDRLLVRVAAYGPGNSVPLLSVHLVARAGQVIAELPAAPSASPGVQQFHVPTAGLAQGDYLVEIKALGDGDPVTQVVGFRVVS